MNIFIQTIKHILILTFILLLILFTKETLYVTMLSLMGALGLTVLDIIRRDVDTFLSKYYTNRK